MHPRRRQTRPQRRRRHRAPRVGQIIWTPAVAQSYMRQTAAMFDAVDRDWHAARAAGKVPDPVWKNWAAFLAAWRAFERDASAWTGGTIDRMESYRVQLAVWRARLRPLGWKAASMPIPKPTPSWVSKFGRDFALALGIAGGTALILYMIKGAVSRG